MNSSPTSQQTAAREFAAFWTGKGYEKGQTQSFPCFLALLLTLPWLFNVQSAWCEEVNAPTEPMTAEEAIVFADETLTTPVGSFQEFLRVIETNSDVFVVGLLAATNNIVRPPLPEAPYCLRIWVNRNTREILPAPMTTSPGLTVSNVVDIVRNEDPHYSYGTNAPVVITHLSETTIARFPVKRPPLSGTWILVAWARLCQHHLD